VFLKTNITLAIRYNKQENKLPLLLPVLLLLLLQLRSLSSLLTATVFVYEALIPAKSIYLPAQHFGRLLTVKLSLRICHVGLAPFARFNAFTVSNEVARFSRISDGYMWDHPASARHISLPMQSTMSVANK